MKIRTELYNLVIEEQRTIDTLTQLNELSEHIILKDFLEYYYEKFNCNIKEESPIHDPNLNPNNDGIIEEIAIEKDNDKKIDLKSKSICYYIKSVNETSYSDDNIDKTRNILINYIKYAKKVKVVDKNTLEEKFTKDKNQGDLEKQHYIIRSFSKTNRALIVWEKVHGAVALSLFEKHMNSTFKKWIRETYIEDTDTKFDLLGYNIKLYAVPSNNFIEEIERMDKISVLNVSVKKEKLTSDDDILYSEENVARDYVDLTYKPVKDNWFSKPNVIKYFENFRKNDNIKRLVIKGRREGSSISLDTDLMKVSEYIDINLNNDGLVNSDDLFDKYTNLMNNYYQTMNDNIAELELSEEEC